MEPTYRTKEFAALAGLTVRTLHHYDRLGVLQPERTAVGYRVYSTSHLARLEQILALRFVGIPLREIAAVLAAEHRDLAEVLAAQQQLLRARRQQIDRALTAIANAESALRSGHSSLELFAQILKEVHVDEQGTQHAEFLDRYYSEDAQATLADKRKSFSAADQEAITAEWQALFADVRAAFDRDPASSQAQGLLARWDELVGRFTGGNAGIATGLKKAWSTASTGPPG